MPLREHQWLGAQSRFDLAGQFRKRGRIARGHLGEHLAIEDHTEFLEAKNELAVSQLLRPHRGADARNPEAPEIALAPPPVAVGVAARLVRGLRHEAVELAF